MSKYLCKDCNKYFSSKFNCSRHNKKCFQRLQNEIELLKKEKEVTINNVTNITNTNTNNNQNNFIFINNFNERNVESLTNKIMKSCIDGDEMTCITRLIRHLHFNKELPENHNMYITDLNRDIAKIYNDNRWESVKSSEIIDGVIDKIEILITDWLYDLTDKKLHRDMEFQFDSYNRRKDDEIKALITNIKQLMYNNRDIVIDTIEKQTNHQ